MNRREVWRRRLRRLLAPWRKERVWIPIGVRLKQWTQRIENVKISRFEVSHVTQKYDNDFKLHAVQLALEGHKPASEIARDLGISAKSLYGWIAKYREDPETPFVGSGNLRPEAKAIRDLERENRQLREENEILKKAMRIFASDRK